MLGKRPDLLCFFVPLSLIPTSLTYCRRPSPVARSSGIFGSQLPVFRYHESSRSHPPLKSLRLPVAQHHETKDDLHDYDALVSDEDYVVIDGKDVDRLVEEMIAAGRDKIEGEEDDREMFMRLAETADNRLKGRVATAAGHEDQYRMLEESNGEENSNNVEKIRDEMGYTMDYFTEKNVAFMPKWAAEAYRRGEHSSLIDEQNFFGKGRGSLLQRLRKRRERTRGDNTSDPPEGKEEENKRKQELKEQQLTEETDYSIAEIADDYNVPVEFLVDMMVEFGIVLPIEPTDGVRERLDPEHLDKIERILTTYDSYDLSDRYSDRTLLELCEHYDIPSDRLLAVCEEEGVYVSRGMETRLHLAHEDGVLDVALGRIQSSRPYPSVLEGL